MPRARRLALVAASAALAAGSLSAAGCGDDPSSASGTTGGGGASGTIAGAGSSAQSAAQEAWRAGFQERNAGATVSYDPVGSGGGRTQFIAGGVDFAASDSALAGHELSGAQKRCGGPDALVEVPVYISPIAIAYNLKGVDALRLAPDTLAKILKHDITSWDDPAIRAENPGVDLPSSRITTVTRSDESGTTQNVQEYLHAVAPKVWTDEPSSTWPVSGGESAQGTSGVVDAIGAGEGTIGYADESQVGDLGVASIKVGSEYVAPSAAAAAAILDESPRSPDPGAHVLTYALKRTSTNADTYPIVLTSYALACTRYPDASTASLVRGYLTYVTSPAGQRAAAAAAGSAPLSPRLTRLVAPAVASIGR
jgi:phosphate transport system substrate-binding protein